MEDSNASDFLQQTQKMSVEEMMKLYIILASHKHDTVLGIMTDRYDHAKLLSRQLDDLIHTIPEWFRTELTRRQISNFEFANGSKIIVMNNPNHLKGRTLSMIAFANRVNWTADDLLCGFCSIQHSGPDVKSKIIRFE